MTPAEYRAQAASLRESAAEFRQRAEQLRAEAAEWEMRAVAALNLAAVQEAMARMAEEGALPSGSEPGTVGNMLLRVQTGSRGAAISATMAKNGTAFQRALAMFGLSMPEWAESHGKKPNTVKSWVKHPSRGGRPIPREYAEAIAKEFVDPRTGESLVPAVDTVWPNGIR